MLERLPLLSAGISLRPALACELSPVGVYAARSDGESLFTHFTPLAGGALAAGTRPPNILDRPAIVKALREAITSVAERGHGLPGGRSLPGQRALTLIVPDAAVRVLLLDFDALPSKRAEALSIVRFRLRKLVPFEVEDAVISYQLAAATGEQVRVLATVIPREVLLEYESVVREAGFYAGVVLPSTLAAITLLSSEPALLVNRNGNTLTTAIVRGDELLLHRALEFEQEAAEPARYALPRLESDEALREDDIRQTVSVALAYYEDTLTQSPSALYYIGPGTADDFRALLGPAMLAPREPGEPALAVRELLPSNPVGIGPATRALVAPVAGALVNA